MVEATSVENAVRYGKLDEIRRWIWENKNPDRLGKLLILAAGSKHADTATLRILLAAGADPNFIEIHKSGEHTYESGPPLSEAAQRGTLEKVKMLVEAGADLHFSASYGFNAVNALAFNCADNAESIARYLLAQGVDPNVESKYNETALSVLSRRGLFQIIRILLDAGVDPAPLGWNALMHAIALGTLDECKAAIASGCDLHARDHLWQRTAFLLSIQVGDIDKGALLLDAGAKLDDKGRCGRTNLMYAALNNHAEMMKWLISKGADIRAVDDFQTTALIESASCGAAECVEVLLHAGADLNAETHTQSSAITEAANITTVQVLTSAGADINKIAGDGYNLLMYAAERGNAEFINQLLKAGANPNIASTGEVPLHKATYADNIEIMRLLLQNDADPNAQDVDGYTPLFSAKSKEAACVLLEAGADPLVKDMFGQNAIEVLNNEIADYISNWKK